MVVAFIKFELNMENTINTNLILDILLILRFGFSWIKDDKLLLSGNPVIIAINRDNDKVLNLHDNPIIGLELFLDPIEAEIIISALVEDARGFQVAHEAEELGVLVLIELVLDQADQLDPDPLVFHLRAWFYLDRHLPFHVFTVREHGRFHLVPLAVP